MPLDDLEEQIPSLRRYALALVRDRVRADDLVQDTLERALRKFSLWRRGSNLRTWLFAIMHNLFMNQLRRERTAAETSLTEGAPELSVAPSDEHALDVRDLIAALDQLPVEYREVVLLVGLEELSYREVARALGIPLGTVMSRLSRGRERLRTALAGDTGPQLRRVK